MHHTAESRYEQFFKNFAVCISPQSQTLRCASYHRVKLRGVHHLSSVCFNPKFYECYFSEMPKDINMRLILVSHKLFKESFLIQKFFEKMESKDVASTKTQKTDIFESV